MDEFLAIIAALLAALSTIPYLIDIVRGKTKPNIVSWFTWTMLTIISGSAALAADEPKTALLLYGNSVCTGLVVIFGLRYGYVRFTRFDVLCQVGALFGLAFWLAFNSPVIGIIIPIIIDFIGLMPTLRHAWHKPGEETWQTFAIGTVASTLTVVALTRYNVVSLLFPLYIILANSVIVSTVIYRRKRQGLPLGRSPNKA